MQMFKSRLLAVTILRGHRNAPADDAIKKRRRSSLLIDNLAFFEFQKPGFLFNIRLLVLDRIDSLDEIRKKIESVTSMQILETANDILDPNKLSVLKYS